MRARGWCNVHYRRWLRTGDPLLVKVIHGDVEARFWSKVDKNGPRGCWLWTGCLNDDGYGLLGIGGTRNRLAHRWSYERHVGPIPAGLELDHKCRVRSCVNHAHLEPVTRDENQRRGATNGNKTECPQGHPYDDENTQWVLVRVCRACRTAQKRRSARKSDRRVTDGGPSPARSFQL